MYDKLDLEFLHSFLLWLLHQEGIHHLTPILFELAWSLSVLLCHNPGIILAEVPGLLHDDPALLQLSLHIPLSYSRIRQWWSDYLCKSPNERLAIELFIDGRIREFLSVMAQRWEEEVSL